MSDHRTFFLKFLDGEDLSPTAFEATVTLTFSGEEASGNLTMTSPGAETIPLTGTTTKTNNGTNPEVRTFNLIGDHAVSSLVLTQGMQILQDPPTWAGTGAATVSFSGLNGLAVVAGLTRES